MRTKRISPRMMSMIILVTLFFGILACSMPGSQAQNGIKQTQEGLIAQQTAIQQTLQAVPTVGEVKTEPTATEEQPTIPVPTATEEVQPTQTPTNEPTTAPTSAPTQDIQARIKSARILVYEDIRGNPELPPRIEKALNGLGLKGSNVVKVGDAQGNFMRQLTGAKWDLIIVGAENRNAPSGDFWDIINQRVGENTALITEIWNLNQIANGKISQVLYQCGLEFQQNWERNPGYDLNDYMIYPQVPDHPIFNTPNRIGVIDETLYWHGDVGDLLELAPGSKAEIVASTQPQQGSSYGVISTCLDGRVVFQTFSTHDYSSDATVALWQNYIIYTLTNHFKVVP
jgi:hypothetical protein